MKKFFSALMIAVCIGMALPAQAQLHFGVKGGLNLSKASFSKDDFKKDNFTGFFIGPMAEFSIPIVGLGVDAALLYSQRGVELAGEKVKQSGLDIPVNLKYTIGLGSLLGIYIAAGPDFYFDFAKDKTIAENIRVDKRKAQVGINLGAGVKLVKHLQLGFNYNIPLSNTAKLEVGGVSESYKTKTWQISAAYVF